ncbi:hypothetical protein JKP88DRAFT_283369 [Tribonema minus]|uniref:Uncharacterized protein n=1 Tax=Tribonema minus TaxID=303371 RepID=A0A835YI09_9STRA|nr:hypothetical protein JKP88DRAFT_283369 [Tribonema minus]
MAAAPDTAAITAALQQADENRACISANLQDAAAGPDGTITLVAHNNLEGEGRIAYFLTRAKAMEFIRKNHGTFNGLLLDARQGGYAIAACRALRSDGSCSPEVVLDLRLELRRRGGGGSGTDFVCAWAQFHRFEQDGSTPQDA